MEPTLIQLNRLMQEVQILREEIEIADEIIENLFEDNEVLLEYALNEKKQWIQQAIKKPGALRKSLKVKEGKNIPVEKLKKAASQGNTKKAKRARLALTLRNLKDKKS